MPSSGYTAISFVANEQPTTAKWNLIGSNDSAFNLGTGLEDNTILTRHIAANAITYAHLLTTLFSGQITTDTNPGAAGGSRNRINVGGIKIGWGTTAALNLANNANQIYAVTFGATYAANPFMIGYAHIPADNRISSVLNSISTTAGAILLQSNNSVTNNIACDWFVIGV